MTPRENMLSLYRREGYAFAPVEFHLCPALQEKMRQAIGDVTPAEYFEYPEGFSRVGVSGPLRVQRPEPDWRAFYPEPLHAETTFDDYGVAYEGGHVGAHHLKRMHHPLAQVTSLEELQAYPWPAWDFSDIAHMQEVVKQAKQNGLASLGGMACTIWETSWYIRDMTQLMMDMAMEDDKATFILDTVTDNAVRRATAFARAGVDIIAMGDDIGMQQTIMMSLDMYREWLKPRLRKVIAAAKQEKPDVLVIYHSCGYVEPYIPDLIEIGVDVLNPVQPECMDFAALHREYGDRLSFNGTLGTQSTMPFGTPDEVRRVVHRNLDIAGTAGGLFVAPTHLLEPEVPWENVAAYVRACKEYHRVGG